MAALRFWNFHYGILHLHMCLKMPDWLHRSVFSIRNYLLLHLPCFPHLKHSWVNQHSWPHIRQPQHLKRWRIRHLQGDRNLPLRT